MFFVFAFPHGDPPCCNRVWVNNQQFCPQKQPATGLLLENEESTIIFSSSHYHLIVTGHWLGVPSKTKYWTFNIFCKLENLYLCLSFEYLYLPAMTSMQLCRCWCEECMCILCIRCIVCMCIGWWDRRSAHYIHPMLRQRQRYHHHHQYQYHIINPIFCDWPIIVFKHKLDSISIFLKKR